MKEDDNMSFQDISINKLELPIILDKLSDFAIIPTTKRLIEKLKPLNNISKITEELIKTKEAHNIIIRSDRAPINISSNFDKIINLSKKSAILTSLDLFEVVRFYETINANIKFLNNLEKIQIPAPIYKKNVTNLFYNETLYKILIKSVDETGYILDDASVALKSVRKRLNQLEIHLKQKLQELINKENSKLSQTSVVLRDDRYCLAVKSEYKNQIKGVIHDISASQQTCFIEPLIVSQIMSDKAKLVEEEKIEVNRILKELSNMITDEIEIIDNSFKIIKEIDFTFAKGLLATTYDGMMPFLNDKGIFNLVNARHPLLNVEKVIPNNVSFGDGYLGIIVTGPNTGGKTVLLKTVGLLSLMIKYGLLIPADETSNIMVFDKVFCDIGDDQSIASNLSTFSSHMNNITNIINNVSPKSLVLFDEIGSGTDPIEGSNLAKAILKYLIKNKVSFITTTHYSDLKAFGFENEDVINASMEFNEKSLSPTYVLKLGVSGSSNAFNIAKRLGLKEEIISDAKEMSATANDDTRKLINKLERASKEFAKKNKEVDELKNKLNESKNEFDKKSEELDKSKLEILKKAKEEADKLVEKITKEAFDALEKVQKLNAENVKLHEIIEAKRAIKDIKPEIKIDKVKRNEEETEIKVGGDVYIKAYDQYGTVQKIFKDGSFEVSVGNMHLTLEKSDIKGVKNYKVEKPKETNLSFAKSKVNVSMTLDLRGKRYEEARDLLDKYIDDLLVVGLKQASIIHGYGTGVIRELVQSFLKKNKFVESFRYGGENEGGFGVTIITLK